eukprot:1121574-Amphidinium_carterae.1
MACSLRWLLVVAALSELVHGRRMRSSGTTVGALVFLKVGCLQGPQGDWSKRAFGAACNRMEIEEPFEYSH